MCKFAQTLHPTKRSVLQVTARIYDPLGIISPSILAMKVLFQKLCKDGGDWDEEFDEENKNIWFKWPSGLSTCQINVSHCYLELPGNGKAV